MTVTELLFNGANLFVLPFWVVMILLPNWGITRWIMNSWLPFIGLVGVYLYLLVGTLTPEVAQSLTNPDLETIARLFSTERAAAAGWIHFWSLISLWAVGSTGKAKTREFGLPIPLSCAFLLVRLGCSPIS